MDAHGRRPLIPPRIVSEMLPANLPLPDQQGHLMAKDFIQRKWQLEHDIFEISKRIYEYCHLSPPQGEPEYREPMNEAEQALYDTIDNYEDANIARQYPYMAVLPPELEAMLNEKVRLLMEVRRLDRTIHAQWGQQRPIH